jgi:hypothetical protein
LSREHIRPALTLLLNLIEAGVRVVQLKPAEKVFDDAVEPMDLMIAIMELSRGHGESAIKSQRVGEAWARKRVKARSGDAVLTLRLPGWVEFRDGKLRLIPEAASVKRIFALAADGYGLTALVKKLVAEGVPPVGRLPKDKDLDDFRACLAGDGRTLADDEEDALKCPGSWRWGSVDGGRRVRVAWVKAEWSRSYVGNVLRDRRVLGEFQPRTRNGAKDGAVM